MKVLDHGYIELVECWGSEEKIVEAARMSTGKGFLGFGTPEKPGDEKLLKYLWDNAHCTPFEMAGLVFEVQAPIFVFREWHRHRTQSYNELSSRYAPLPDVNYVPSIERLMMVGGKNRQAGTVTGAAQLTPEVAKVYLQNLVGMYKNQQALYDQALMAGIPKELARVHLPVGRYSRMRASANLRNWFAFLKLRLAPNAQWEIRQYAKAVAFFVSSNFPRCWENFQQSEKFLFPPGESGIR